MKEIIADIKRKFMPWMILLFFGFVVGKQITYMNIMSDCYVLGMFRIADTPFDCRMSKASVNRG